MLKDLIGKKVGKIGATGDNMVTVAEINTMAKNEGKIANFVLKSHPMKKAPIENQVDIVIDNTIIASVDYR